MARKATINYEDGTTEVVDIKPKHMIAAERIIGKSVEAHQVEAMYLSAWKSVKSPLKFDDWLELVESITGQVDEDAADESVDPTSAPSPAESLT